MKVVRLNRRFKQFREAGHTIALRFPYYGDSVRTVEKIATSRLGGSSWHRDGVWCGYFGSRNGHSDRRPYWITFRRESDLSFLLLSADLTKNS